jgi:hypothetical protein
MTSAQPTGDQTFVLLRHRDCLPCRIAKKELFAQKRKSGQKFIRREIIIIVFLVGLFLTGPKLVRFAEERGYFDWAAEFDVRAVAFVFVGVLLAVFFWVAITMESQKRLGINPPCPKCGKPLIGANLWPPVKLTALAERRERWMKKLLLRAVSRDIIAPAFIIMLVSFPAALLVMRNLRPDLDPNGWPFFVRAFPFVILTYFVAGYLLTLFHVHRTIQRKGTERALKFLVPEAFNGRTRWRDRVFYAALGISAMIRQMR